MATINFYLDKPDKKGLAPIHLRINCSGTQIKLATGQKIAPEQFDKKKQRVSNYALESTEINHYLDFLMARANELLHNSNKKTFSQEEIKEILNQHIEGYKESNSINIVKEQLSLYGKPFTFVDLFAGAGGFSEGFLQAEVNNKFFNFIAASDINENCELTHIVRYNHQLGLNAEFLRQDITEPDFMENFLQKIGDKKIDVVSGFFIPEVHTTFEKYLAGVTVPIVEELQDEKFLPSSRSIAFRKEAWESVNGYPEWLPICEDLIFDIKLKNKGKNFVVNAKALSSWRPRETLKKFFIQYFKYARGDGHAKLWLRRHLIRYVAFITGILLIYMSFTISVVWLAPAFVGGMIYNLKFYNRFFRHFPKEKLYINVGSYFVIPFLVITGDVAKMIGYPVGIVQRLKGKIKFEEYRE